MKEARPANIRSLLLSVLILSSSAFQALAYYHPDEGRWISRDPIGEQGGRNQYAYCGNAPICWHDAFGLIGEWIDRWEGATRSSPETRTMPETGEQLTVSGETSADYSWDVCEQHIFRMCCRIDDKAISGKLTTRIWYVQGDSGAQQHEGQHATAYHNHWATVKTGLQTFEDGWMSCRKTDCLKEAISLYVKMWMKYAYYEQVVSDYNAYANRYRYGAIRVQNSRTDYENLRREYEQKKSQCDGM